MLSCSCEARHWIFLVISLILFPGPPATKHEEYFLIVAEKASIEARQLKMVSLAVLYTVFPLAIGLDPRHEVPL